MELLPPFPVAEDVLMALLEPVADTGTSNPPDLGVDPRRFVRVARIGGTDDGVTDRPRMEVATFAPTWGESQQMQQQCRQIILAAGCTEVASVLIDRGATDTGPIERPYPNPDVRWVPAYYRLEWRRARA